MRNEPEEQLIDFGGKKMTLNEVLREVNRPQQAPSANTLSRLERITGLKFATEDEHFKHIEEKLMHLNPAPSAEENPQPTDEERKHFAEHNNSRIIRYAEAPSATVDEPKHLSSAQRQRLFDLIVDIAGYHLMDDELNAIEGIVYPRTYPYTLKDSQQPTVDVDALFNKHRSAFGDFVLWVGFKNAITEALRGTYAREDMIAFGNACVEECSARASMPKRDFIPIQKLFEQFIEQRNSK